MVRQNGQFRPIGLMKFGSVKQIGPARQFNQKQAAVQIGHLGRKVTQHVFVVVKRFFTINCDVWVIQKDRAAFIQYFYCIWQYISRTNPDHPIRQTTTPPNSQSSMLRRAQLMINGSQFFAGSKITENHLSETQCIGGFSAVQQSQDP